MKQVTTVAGLIFNSRGEILCAQRGVGKYEYISNKWEFPGGKIEEGETKQETLIRELQEELGIEVEILEHFILVEHTYPDFHLTMDVFTCNLLSKDLNITVHQNIKWLNPKDLMQLDWAGADVPIAIKAVKEFSNTLSK